ncbi:MAG: hypothetical protein CVV27_09550 [Candidatus Melainabacteria bacterium HGW-Melainabacteria-1]|nr:MAG: hypothetical protein CVV27_09550 [Candidatus Melainabacteria bacterium HGW-Melainabacteria-1]
MKFSPKRVLLGVLGAFAVWNLNLSPAQAWWETGHMITAQIAYDNLRPEVRSRADKLIAWLDNSEPDVGRRHFVPVSVWMDDTKARGLYAFNEWHYINIPYNPEGLAVTKDALSTNIVTVVETMAKTLSNPKASDFEKAFALRILLHLFGDIHQPYHAVGRISHTHPEGDLGGNRTLLAHHDYRNVHAFWDSTAALYPEVKATQWRDKIPAMSTELQKRFPRDAWSARMGFAPMAWAEESYKLAVRYGYKPLESELNQVEPASKLTPDYIREAQQICAERLALGGYRLAELLNASL